MADSVAKAAAEDTQAVPDDGEVEVPRPKKKLKEGEVLINFNRELTGFDGEGIPVRPGSDHIITMGAACSQALGAADGDDQEVHRCKALALRIMNHDEDEDAEDFLVVLLGKKSRDRIRKALKIWPASIRTAVLEILDNKSHADIIKELNE